MVDPLQAFNCVLLRAAFLVCLRFVFNFVNPSDGEMGYAGICDMLLGKGLCDAATFERAIAACKEVIADMGLDEGGGDDKNIFKLKDKELGTFASVSPRLRVSSFSVGFDFHRFLLSRCRRCSPACSSAFANPAMSLIARRESVSPMIEPCVRFVPTWHHVERAVCCLQLLAHATRLPRSLCESSSASPPPPQSRHRPLVVPVYHYHRGLRTPRRSPASLP